MNQPRRHKLLIITATVLFGGMALACSGPKSADTGSVADPAATAQAAPEAKATPPSVYKFGAMVRFKDGSTLTVGKPAAFRRDQYAVGGEGRKFALKFKATFKNNTAEVFDPALTSASVSAGGVEGDSIFQDGLDAPDNKVLPGKSVTWSMGYGVDSKSDLQLQVTIGFLDYGTVIFTG